ncbi:cyclin-dependent kinase 5 activator 1-like [Pygocentrus nattereri]|uniref:cyclin-dependent kinase 5 activator 1-like n=1 Tax=Pygocentrus nattereri TaxID=42514 RepID=UPI0018914456|nr:cyclin-dependent kinase 5 activator 1-like [Pygocentrus nattereri]
MDACADVLLDQATSTHEMVLKDASTDELLRLLSEFLCRRCCLLKDLSPEDPLMWLRMVDIFLLFNNFQRHCFIVPGSVVFLYMLCRHTVSAEVSSMKELQAVVLTCFYVAYAYIGHELGYPAMPFIMKKTSTVFWKRTLDITKRMSGEMLQINEDPQFFVDIFTALQNGTDH